MFSFRFRCQFLLPHNLDSLQSYSSCVLTLLLIIQHKHISSLAFTDLDKSIMNRTPTLSYFWIYNHLSEIFCSRTFKTSLIRISHTAVMFISNTTIHLQTNCCMNNNFTFWSEMNILTSLVYMIGTQKSHNKVIQKFHSVKQRFFYAVACLV